MSARSLGFLVQALRAMRRESAIQGAAQIVHRPVHFAIVSPHLASRRRERRTTENCMRDGAGAPCALARARRQQDKRRRTRCAWDAADDEKRRRKAPRPAWVES